MSHTVVVTLTDEEYKSMVYEAGRKGLTLSQYVKRFPVGDQDFDSRFEELKNKAKDYERNKTFTVMSLFDDWNDIQRGVKLSLGRTFYHFVKRGELPGVIPAGKNSSNVQLYIRQSMDG
ncbi:MAG TPA: single-stranded DNA-binding protein [Candidatus Avoscillospira avistercoris]|uniref:Single-stranded DNA-binding protein n=1 Tax=Candidatus Avoscillospira avistercoris TaxID=2840707 RepID=A0A9D1F9Z2_9FIRM|nr:single-stranded DNA-binding protein [Candidatus Avoscillospira avistercoris]